MYFIIFILISVYVKPCTKLFCSQNKFCLTNQKLYFTQILILITQLLHSNGNHSTFQQTYLYTLLHTLHTLHITFCRTQLRAFQLAFIHMYI